MLFKLSNLNSNLALTLGYLNPALNNSALCGSHLQSQKSVVSRQLMVLNSGSIASTDVILKT